MIKRPKRINANNAKALMETDGAFFVDVRTPQEFSQGHIPGALSLPLDTLPSRAEKKLPNKDAYIIVYCLSGMRSRSAAKMLSIMGYQNVRNFGAMHRWA